MKIGPFFILYFFKYVLVRLVHNEDYNTQIQASNLL
jgi:hypothetical protein